MGELMTTKEVAAVLGISPAAFRERARRGMYPFARAFKVGSRTMFEVYRTRLYKYLEVDKG